jgi:hypothetical protein
MTLQPIFQFASKICTISFPRLFWPHFCTTIVSCSQLATLKDRHNRKHDRLCGLVVRVLDYRSGGPGSIPDTARKKVVRLERGPLSLVSTTEELLDRNVAAPV